MLTEAVASAPHKLVAQSEAQFVQALLPAADSPFWDVIRSAATFGGRLDAQMTNQIVDQTIGATGNLLTLLGTILGAYKGREGSPRSVTVRKAAQGANLVIRFCIDNLTNLKPWIERLNGVAGETIETMAAEGATSGPTDPEVLRAALDRGSDEPFFRFLRGFATFGGRVDPKVAINVLQYTSSGLGGLISMLAAAVGGLMIKRGDKGKAMLAGSVWCALVGARVFFRYLDDVYWRKSDTVTKIVGSAIAGDRLKGRRPPGRPTNERARPQVAQPLTPAAKPA